jgi:hypothetical protein
VNDDDVPKGYWEHLAMRMNLPLPVVEAAWSAYQSAIEGELGGWEISLLERRIRECAKNKAEAK